MIGVREAARENSSRNPTLHRQCTVRYYNHILHPQFAPKFATTAAMWPTHPQSLRQPGLTSYPGSSLQKMLRLPPMARLLSLSHLFRGESDAFTMPEIETLEDEVGFVKNLLNFALTFSYVNYVLISEATNCSKRCKWSSLISLFQYVRLLVNRFHVASVPTLVQGALTSVQNI